MIPARLPPSPCHLLLQIATDARAGLFDLDKRLRRSLERERGRAMPTALWNNAQLNDLWNEMDVTNEGAVTLEAINRCIERRFPR